MLFIFDMAEQCKNCGGELLEGQQFCRWCGARSTSPDGDAPTQIFVGPPKSTLNTTALPQRGTGEPRLAARPTEQHTPYGGGAYTSHLAASDTHTPSGTSRRWLRPTPLIFILLISGLAGALVIALFSQGWFGKKIVSVADRTTTPGAVAPVRSPEGIALDDDGAVVSERETVIRKVYEVNPDTDFSFKSPDGNLTIEGWDENRVEVTVTKRGGTPEERRNARVTLRQSDKLFSLAAPNSPVKVFFEVRLPRNARRVELSSGTADVKVSKMEAPLAISVRDGGINLEDVRAAVQAKSINGNIEVVYRSTKREGAHEFATVNGNISVRLIEGMEAAVKASVVNGSIEVDSELGLEAQKRQVGWYIDAPLGEGGELLSMKTVNGSIRIEK